MTQLAIRVENLGKEYQLGLREKGYKTLRETIMNAAAAPLRRFRHLSGSSREVERIWALKDVSFEVQPGEVVGIIGRNGAGKTTLLKVLTRITEPTTGRAEIRGHVASLLEVGTGMHPELTGRENIFLNGAVLGMSHATVIRRFDEIVDFSGVEKFLDTPVKRYSSGMRVRLAFAVAAHLEPEILLIDEVLAVGDAEFQKKCLGKMGDVARGGRTVIFVSHNMSAIRSLCTQGIVLTEGKVAYMGEVSEAVEEYLTASSERFARGRQHLPCENTLPIAVTEIQTTDGNGEVNSVFARSKPFAVEISGNITEPRCQYIVAIDISNRDGILLFRTHSFEHKDSYQVLSATGDFRLRCTIPRNFLPAGDYSIGLITAIAKTCELQNEPTALEVQIVQDELHGEHFTRMRGLVTPECTWTKL